MTELRVPGTNRHALCTDASQTRAPNPASVSAEGGGMERPALMGGGTRFSREHSHGRPAELEEAEP